MFVFENDGQRGPEKLRHLAVIPRTGRRLDQYAVVADRDALREGVVGDRKPFAGAVVSGEVVRYAELRVAEMFAVQVDEPFLGFHAPFVSVFGRGHDRMPFAPHAEMAHVDEGHVRIAVVTLGHRPEKVFRFFEKYGVVVFRFDVLSLHVVAPRACVEHPLGSGMVEPALGGGDAESYLTSFVDPSLGGRVEQFPDEAPLFGFEKSPRNTEIDGTQSGKILHRVGRCQPRTVVGQNVGIKVHGPSHTGIDQCPSVVDRFDAIRILVFLYGLSCGRRRGVFGVRIFRRRRCCEKAGPDACGQSCGEESCPAQESSSVYFFHRVVFGSFPKDNESRANSQASVPAEARFQPLTDPLGRLSRPNSSPLGGNRPKFHYFCVGTASGRGSETVRPER